MNKKSKEKVRQVAELFLRKIVAAKRKFSGVCKKTQISTKPDVKNFVFWGKIGTKQNPKGEQKTMKVNVNEDCIGCGLCESMCPQVFQMEGDRSCAISDDDAYLEGAQEAAAACPVSAISVE